MPVEYHHVVFTLPATSTALALAEPGGACTTLLFEAAAETLREVAANPKRLGARVGLLVGAAHVGPEPAHHPHVHCVVTGGGLS